jgi:hypothetical protein
MRLSFNLTALIAFAVLMLSHSRLTSIAREWGEQSGHCVLDGSLPYVAERFVVFALALICLLGAVLHSTV